jgi:hypothetical protein
MEPNPDSSLPSKAAMSDLVRPRAGARHTAFLASANVKTPIQAQVDRELRAIPRGDVPQNLYSAAYEQARLNGLGSKAQVGESPEDAQVAALAAIRAHHPDFVPTPR